jgi:hypothetical protein
MLSPADATGGIMNTQQFLDYLHDNVATRNLAEEIAYALALRGRANLVPSSIDVSEPRRIAS